MSRALREYQVVGLPNNIDFLLRTVNHPGFVKGGVDTSFLAHHLQECLPIASPAPVAAVVIAGVATSLRTHFRASQSGSPWESGLTSRPMMPSTAKLTWSFVDPEAAVAAAAPEKGKQLAANSRAYAEVTYVGPGKGVSVGRAATAPGSLVSGQFVVKVGTTTHTVYASYSPSSKATADLSVVKGFEAATRGKVVPGIDAGSVTVEIDGVTYKGTVVHNDDPKEGLEVAVFTETPLQQPNWPEGAPLPHSYRLLLPAAKFGRSTGRAGGASVITPMPGKVVKIIGKVGESVAEGAPLMILEAMKMEHVIKAPIAGVLSAINFKEGDFVDDGKELISFAAAAKK
jgi:3-methylcrotonyl-CoA carboxylase alpha subunit